MSARRGRDGKPGEPRRLGRYGSTPAVGADGAPPKPAGPQREASYLRRGREEFKRTLRDAARYREIAKSPYGLRPVVVFTIILGAASLDARVFGLAVPEIIRDLDIDILPLIGIFTIISFFLTFITLGLAQLADRTRRVPFIGIGAILSGVASLFTSGSRGQYDFAVSRAADAAGGTVLSVPASSLNADYYPVDVRGKVFALTGVISRVIGVASPFIVVYLATATDLSWRLPYLITGPLLILAGIVALIALREPVRGYMERRAIGLDEKEAREPEDPVSFGEAWRTVWSIRTLRRLFIAAIPGSMADFIYGIFFTIFIFETYNLTLRERGYLFGALGLFALPFGFYAGGVIDVLLRRRPQRVLIFTGVLSLLSSLFVFFIATSPPLWALAVGFIGFGAASALFGPAKSVIFVQILPAHVRTMGSWIPLLAEVPGTILRVFIVGYALDNYGTAGVITAAGALFLLNSLIELSAAGLLERDMRSAFASQAANAAWRQARQEGRGKLLVCRDVDVEYDGVQVLFGVDFDVDEGDIIAVLGTNGAGKSTLLRAISGVREAVSGAIVFDGRDITHMPPHEVAARGVISMPGGRGVFPDLTVRENLTLGGWMSEDEAEGKRRLDEAYDIFPILRERGGERAQLLSGGEQQMLSLAMAFLNKPKLLIIDELSLGLAPVVVQQLTDVVRMINKQGTAVIVVEQSVNVALTLADRAIFMEKGEVKFVGRTEDLLARPDILRAVYVKGTGAAAPSRSAVKGEKELRRYDLDQARSILEVQGVWKSFGGVVACRDVTIAVREGEALGLIGPNGAGKTTIFDIVSGYQRPDAGAIIYDGVDVTDMSAEERARHGMIRRFQDARLFPSLSVYENILVALERRLEVRSMTLTALQVPQARQAERNVRRRADVLLELLDLGAYRDKFVKELSTGLRRITDIACVLATMPKFLLLDEPSTGIAQAETENLAPLLRRVRHETGCSMMIIEHDMSLIAQIADELLAMDQGETVVRGTPDVVLNDERVVASYLGTSEDAIQRSGRRKAKVGERT